MSDSTRHQSFRVGDEITPTYTFPENAARTLGKLIAYSSWRLQRADLYYAFDDVHVEEARAIDKLLFRAKRVYEASTTVTDGHFEETEPVPNSR